MTGGGTGVEGDGGADPSAGVVLLVCRDLFWSQRLRAAAAQAGLDTVDGSRTAPAQRAHLLLRPDLRAALVDLEHADADPWARAIAACAGDRGGPLPWIGFLSHVRADRAEAARAAGCPRILARSAMARDTAALLADLVNSGDGRPFPAP